MTAINAKIIDWFESRGISADTVIRLGVHSGQRIEDESGQSSVIPSSTGNVIVFPLVDAGETIGARYRASGKKFWQTPNTKKTFFNAEILDDPLLASGAQALIITEGEIDCMTAIEAGYPFTVSVPDGAPPGRDKEGKLIAVPETTAGIDPTNDPKFEYIVNNWDRLKVIKRIIIAADGDEPGKRLAGELVRRLGRVRCFFITYPDGCKDLNDVLKAHGAAEVMRIITTAKPYPVSGVYKLSEFPEEASFETFSTGWNVLDKNLKLYYPALMVVTGLAGSGKSTWANQLVAQMAHQFGWRAAIASFEMRIRPYVTDTLGRVHLRKPKEDWNSFDKQIINDWIEDRFTFIAPDPDDDASHDLDWLLERAETAVIRHGIRILLVDPWNEIDHRRQPDESGNDYQGRAIRMLKTFMRKFDILVIVVAHPTKGAADKPPDKISLYDISDTSHWANKPDLGVVIARMAEGTATIVKKVRYQPDTGEPGRVDLQFDRATRLFIE